MKDFDKEITKVKEQLSALYEKRKPIDEQITKLQKKAKKLREDKEKYELTLPRDREEEIKYFLFEDGYVNGERYKAREKYWRDKGLWHSGYFHEIEQINLRMMLYKGDSESLENTIKAVEEVIPFLKPLKGKKRLDIFEHTLSENGSWSVEIDEDSIDLVLHRYHRKTVEKSFKTVREMVEYVQAHHYYSDGGDE